MKERIESLRAFLDAAHSVYHANAIVRTLLEEDGYRLLAEQEDWTEEDWRQELRQTLAHELTHHMESRAGTHALDDRHAAELAEFRREFGEE